MRVISGKYRGKKLNTIDSEFTRPTTDRVKENVFNLLPHQFNEEVKVLDIFSGSGAIAIEFASRGAKKIWINELSQPAISVINKNISEIDSDFVVTNFNAFEYSKNIKETFDYIYIDGPYDKYDINNLILSLSDNITSQSILIIETKETYKNKFNKFEILKEKKYGKTKIWILRRNNEEG